MKGETSWPRRQSKLRRSGEKVSNWVRDLLDQRADLRVEIGRMGAGAWTAQGGERSVMIDHIYPNTKIYCICVCFKFSSSRL